MEQKEHVKSGNDIFLTQKKALCPTCRSTSSQDLSYQKIYGSLSYGGEGILGLLRSMKENSSYNHHIRGRRESDNLILKLENENNTLKREIKQKETKNEEEVRDLKQEANYKEKLLETTKNELEKKEKKKEELEEKLKADVKRLEYAIKTLENDKRENETKTGALEGQIELQQQTIEKKQKEIQKLKNEVGEKEKAIQNLKQIYKEDKNGKEVKISELERKVNDQQKLEQQKQIEKSQLEAELKTTKMKVINLGEELSRMERQNTKETREMKTKLEVKEHEIAKLRQEIDKNKKEEKEIITELKMKINDLENFDKKRLEDIEALKTNEEKKNCYIKELTSSFQTKMTQKETELEKRTETINLQLIAAEEIKNENEELYTALKRTETTIENLKEKISTKENTIQCQKQKLDTAKETLNIPNIQRQLKLHCLSSRYEDLLQIRQTAEQDLQFQDDETRTKMLLDALKECYKLCQKTSVKKVECLQNVLMSTGEGHGSNDTWSPMPFKQTMFKNCKELIAQTTKGTDYFVEILDQQQDSKLNDVNTIFVRKCIEICWSMILHDPQIVFEEEAVRGQEFDTQKYRYYNDQSVEGCVVEYTVWPPMILDNGVLLCKGVAKPSKKME